MANDKLISDLQSSFNRFSIKWDGLLFTSPQDFYNHVAATQPRNPDGTFQDANEILSRLFLLIPDAYIASDKQCTIYIEPVDPGHMIIDNWLLNCDELFHIHPEFGIVDEFMEAGKVIATVNSSKCTLCRAEHKGEIKMIHTFYNMG